MLVADVLEKLELYKDRMIEIGLSDEGQVLYSGIDGHWLFIKGDNLVYVRKNTTGGINGVGLSDQRVSPFSISTVPCDIVNYIKSYIPAKQGAIAKDLEGLTPVGTSKSFDDIIAEIESDSILKAHTPNGNLVVDDVTPGGFYGAFKGSAISTERGGLPKYMDDLIVTTDDVS